MPRGLCLFLWILGVAVKAMLWPSFKRVATAILSGCLFSSCCAAHEKHKVVFLSPTHLPQILHSAFTEHRKVHGSVGAFM